MKWKLINSIPKRIGLAVILGAILHVVIALMEAEFIFDGSTLIIYAAFFYIAITILNAVITTFFQDDQEE